LKQKKPGLLGLALKDLFGEIAHNVVMAAGERRDKAMNIANTFHRNGSQLKTCDPAFRPRLHG
jgi:hypothetical protein